jgi:hypothetical protein
MRLGEPSFVDSSVRILVGVMKIDHEISRAPLVDMMVEDLILVHEEEEADMATTCIIMTILAIARNTLLMIFPVTIADMMTTIQLDMQNHFLFLKVNLIQLLSLPELLSVISNH